MAEYPREIYLDTDTEERLASYLETELANHYMERGGHVDDLMRWQKDYWAKPTTEQATFPFTGAATIVIPLSAIAVEAVHARSMMTLAALPQLVTAIAVSPEWDQAVRPLELFLDHELLNEMRIRKPLGDCFLEATKFGTMIGKTGYEKITKTAIRAIGEVEEEFDVIVKDGATFDCVPDSRFLMPYSSKDPNSSPWVGEEHTASTYHVMNLERGGMFRSGTVIDEEGADEDIEKQSKLGAYIRRQANIGSIESGGRKFDDNQSKLDNTEPIWPNTLDWLELWLSFDIDLSGIEKEIVVHYHRESKTFMSIRYNWHTDLRRPYRTNVYFPVEHRWRGIGICKQNEQFQREVTTQHRQRLDNATLANMRMIVVSKLSGYGPKEPVFPGKMWFVDDMTHIDTLQMGEIYPSAYNNEQATLIYSQQRTGVNEVTLGMPQVGTPGTATSDLARIQEGNKKSDFIYANFKEFTSDIIVDTASNIQQFGPRRIDYFDHAENGQLVKKFFDMPAELINSGILLQLKVAGQQQNKVLDRQNWTQQAALLQQYYVGLLQLAQPLGDENILKLITMKGMGAATEAMRQILESFDTRNVDRIIVRELEAIIQNGLSELGAQQGGDSGPAGIGSAAPMGDAAQIVSGAGNNSNGGFNRIQGF